MFTWQCKILGARGMGWVRLHSRAFLNDDDPYFIEWLTTKQFAAIFWCRFEELYSSRIPIPLEMIHSCSILAYNTCFIKCGDRYSHPFIIYGAENDGGHIEDNRRCASVSGNLWIDPITPTVVTLFNMYGMYYLVQLGRAKYIYISIYIYITIYPYFYLTRDETKTHIIYICKRHFHRPSHTNAIVIILRMYGRNIL